MIKRIVIAGCRKYDNYNQAKEFIDLCLKDISCENEIAFISGCCKGADMLGERYAIEKGFKIERYPANWSKYGKSAGPLRNEQMAKVCDLLICFWDGKSRGTLSMIKCAEKCNKEIIIKKVSV